MNTSYFLLLTLERKWQMSARRSRSHRSVTKQREGECIMQEVTAHQRASLTEGNVGMKTVSVIILTLIGALDMQMLKMIRESSSN